MKSMDIENTSPEEIEILRKLPQADSFQFGFCKNCPNVHIFLKDEDGKFILHVLFSLEQLSGMLEEGFVRRLAQQHNNKTVLQ